MDLKIWMMLLIASGNQVIKPALSSLEKTELDKGVEISDHMGFCSLQLKKQNPGSATNGHVLNKAYTLSFSITYLGMQQTGSQEEAQW